MSEPKLPEEPQRSCLGNKTEAWRWSVRAQLEPMPQRSCLGNKTEAQHTC